MPALPPSMWAELFYDNTWNTVSDMRQTSSVSVTRGLSSESASDAEPTTSSVTLDSRDHKYAPRNPSSVLFGKIGRNTPFRWGYNEGGPWLASDGTGTSGLTTPDQAAFDVSDLDVRVDIALDSWETQQALFARYTASGDNRAWGVYLAGTGQLALVWSPTGTSSTTTEFSDVNTPLVAYNGQRMALRVTLDVSNTDGVYEIRFYTGRTVDDEEWNLLGDPILGGAATTLPAVNSRIEFGDFSGLVLNAMTGKGYAMKLLSSIGGATAMTMSTSDGVAGGSSFVSNGLTWTLNTGVTLSNKHIRMVGEIPSWPPTRDLSGNNTVVDIEPTDLTRRMDAGTKPVDSALLRFIKANGPIECWPLTDSANVTTGKSMNGSANMQVNLEFGTAQPSWGGGSLAEWIEPVVAFPTSTDGTMRASTPRNAGAASGWTVDFFFAGKQYADFLIADHGDLSDADPRIGWFIEMDQTTDQITLLTSSVGDTGSSQTLQSTITTAGVFDGSVHHIRLTTVTTGSNADFEIFIDGVSRDTGTATGYGSEAVRYVQPGWFLGSVTQDPPSIGYITYWGSSGVPSASGMYEAAAGYPGERAGTRIARIATEAGYVATVAGETSYQRRMGVQSMKTLLELFNEANKTNFGYFVGARDRLEVIHRGQSTLWNQPPGITLDFSAGLISAPFKPVDDDKLTENDVTVKREFGAYPARQVLEEGTLSVQDFPDGVGRYDKDHTYSLYEDSQADQVAYMRLHLGTYDGVRYTRITLDLANTRVNAMLDDILRLDVGDKIRLTDVPSDHGPDDVDVLIQGYTEEAGPKEWKITFNCIPGDPWNAAVVESSTYGRVDTAGCQLNEALDSSETGVDVLTTAEYRWVDSATYPSDFPFDVRTGGEVMRVTACTGTGLSQTFTVTRGINGVTKSHATGQDIRLANPVYVAP